MGRDGILSLLLAVIERARESCSNYRQKTTSFTSYKCSCSHSINLVWVVNTTTKETRKAQVGAARTTQNMQGYQKIFGARFCKKIRHFCFFVRNIWCLQAFYCPFQDGGRLWTPMLDCRIIGEFILLIWMVLNTKNRRFPRFRPYVVSNLYFWLKDVYIPSYRPPRHSRVPSISCSWWWIFVEFREFR